MSKEPPSKCQFCGDKDHIDDMYLCAGCRRIGCSDCVEWRTDADDDMDGEYFCETCVGQNREFHGSDAGRGEQ